MSWSNEHVINFTPNSPEDELPNYVEYPVLDLLSIYPDPFSYSLLLLAGEYPTYRGANDTCQEAGLTLAVIVNEQQNDIVSRPG